MTFQQGNGLFDKVKQRVRLFLDGPRQDKTKRFDEFLSTMGSLPIAKIQVARKPVQSAAQKVMNILSLGRFNKKKKELGYDDVYHQYLVITLEDGRQFKVEKNQVVEANPVNPKDLREAYDLPTPAPGTTTKDLINNAVKTAEGNLWLYDPKNKNCQMFVHDVLESSNLMPEDPKVQSIVEPQKAEELVGTIPGALQGVPRFITDIGARVDRLIHGDGVKVGARLYGGGGGITYDIVKRALQGEGREVSVPRSGGALKKRLKLPPISRRPAWFKKEFMKTQNIIRQTAEGATRKHLLTLNRKNMDALYYHSKGDPAKFLSSFQMKKHSL